MDLLFRLGMMVGSLKYTTVTHEPGPRLKIFLFILTLTVLKTSEQYVSDNQAFLTWKLTSSDCSKIVIEKSSNSVSFETLKELDYGTTEYIDNSSNVVNSVYRIVSICSNNVRKHSNPYKVTR